jgi:hypothetical protein
MGVDAWGRKIVALSAAIALAAGCSRPAMSARDAAGAGAPGVAESQPSDAPAPAATGTAAAPAPPPAAGTAEASAPPPAAGTPEASAGEGSNVRPDPHRTRRVVGWVSLTIGAEAAVVALVTSLLIEHQKGLRDDNCNAQKVCNTTGFGAVSTIDTIVPWNTTTWFVAAAGLGLGTVLLLVSKPESEKQTAITVSPVSSGLGLGLRSTF